MPAALSADRALLRPLCLLRRPTAAAQAAVAQDVRAAERHSVGVLRPARRALLCLPAEEEAGPSAAAGAAAPEAVAAAVAAAAVAAAVASQGGDEEMEQAADGEAEEMGK